MSAPTGPRFLALGDSYTIGEGVAPEARWPNQVAARLRASGVETADPEIVAVTGWTTDELDAGIDEASPEPPYALVTLLIGVNNQYRGRPLNEYREQFRGLLARAIGFASGDASRVVVVSFPDWGVTAFGRADARGPEAIAEEVDAFNAIAQEEADAAGARWISITALSRMQGAMTVDDDL
ncbi:MAG: GDSL-type esterase/lipase family protein, partial [Bacteroidota bacterium]